MEIQDTPTTLTEAYEDICHRLAELSALVDEFVASEGNILGKEKAEAYERLLKYIEQEGY